MTNIDEVQTIDNQIAELQAKRRVLLDTQRKQGLDQAKALISTFGFSAAELGLGKSQKTGVSKKTGKPRQPRYVNPADSNQTWGGGARPKWVQAHLDNGGSLDDLRIKG